MPCFSVPPLILRPGSETENKISTSLQSCSCVFVPEDAAKPPLSLLYRGPYFVLNRPKSDSVSMTNWNQSCPPSQGRPPAPKLPTLKPPDPVQKPFKEDLQPCNLRPWNLCLWYLQLWNVLHLVLLIKNKPNLVPGAPIRFSSLPSCRNPKQTVWDRPHPL